MMNYSSTLECIRNSESAFGPAVHACGSDSFDFTLLFEDSILTLGLQGMLLLLLPVVLTHLFRNHDVKVTRLGSWTMVAKVCFFCILSALQLAMLILWVSPPAVRSPASIPSAAVAFVTTLGYGLLSYGNQRYALRPSTLITTYLLLSILTDVVRTRTLWFIPQNRLVSCLSTTIVSWKVVILLLENRGKRSLLRLPYAQYPPEALSGIISRSVFWWLNPLFVRGYQEMLSMDSLYPVDPNLSAPVLLENVRFAWDKHVRTTKRPSLFGVILWSLIRPFLEIVPPLVAVTCLEFAQPFLVHRTLDWYSAPTNEETSDIGYGLLGAYILVYIGLAVGYSISQHKTYRFITMARGALVSLIYSKTLELDVNSTEGFAPLTLMSTDVQRICDGLEYIHRTWANMTSVAIATWLIQRQIGIGVIGPILIALVTTLVSGGLASLMGPAQSRWMQAIQARIDTTTIVLSGIKSAKMAGLMHRMSCIIQGMRISELQISSKFRRILTAIVGLSFANQTLSPVVAFMIYTLVARSRGEEPLTTSTAFTAFSLFSLLSSPLDTLIQTLPNLVSAYACFGRVQSFLLPSQRRSWRQDTVIGLPHEVEKEIVEDVAINVATTSSKKTDLVDDKKQGVGQETLLSATNCVFTWPGSDITVLRNVNLQLRRHQITFVIGPSGCGKTSLLVALLGEMMCSQGTIHWDPSFDFDHQVGYCGQIPWLRNGSVRQNIISTLPLDEAWYDRVLHACALDSDFGGGEDRRIGSGAVTLSGGQKQRIALARAVYARKELILLDDIFNGLDSTTERVLFESLLGSNGLLRQLGVSIVLATHLVHRVGIADRVIVLDKNGGIEKQGPPQLLGLTHRDPRAVDLMADTISKPGTDGALNTTSNSPLAVLQGRIAEATARRSGEIMTYKYYLASLGWRYVVVTIVLTCSFVFCTLYPQIWVEQWTASNISRPNDRLGYWLGIYYLIAILALAVVTGACWLIFITMVKRSAITLHWTLVKTLFRTPMSFIDSTDTGSLANRFSQDMQLVDMELPMAAANTLISFISCIGQVIMLSITTRYLAVAIPFIIIIFILVQRVYLRTSRQLRYIDLESKSSLYTQMIESLDGLVTIRAFGLQSSLIRETMVLLDNSQRPFYLLYCVQRWLGVVLNLVNAGLAAVIVGLVIALRGTLSDGFIGVALINLMSFGGNLSQLIRVWTSMEMSLAAVDRVKSFADSTPRETVPTSPIDIPARWPEAGGVEFHNVTVSYDATSRPALADVSFSVMPGEKIAIVGTSGSGKSSLLLALFHMLDLDAGSICIDGIDIAQIAPEIVRQHLTAVPQDPFLFPGSLRQNLDPNSLHSDAQIIKLVQQVGLWQVVEGKGGIGTTIADLSLSQGHRQLVCLARALLRKPKLLILDEATSSVDYATEGVVHSLITAAPTAETTVISVMHRLDNILDFDKVAMLRDGRLVEYDTPAALLASASSSDFAKLYDNHTQSGSVRDPNSI